MSELVAFFLGGVIVFVTSAAWIWRPRLHELMAANRHLRSIVEHEYESHLEAIEDVRILPTWEDPMEMLIGDDDG